MAVADAPAVVSVVFVVVVVVVVAAAVIIVFSRVNIVNNLFLK